jgi:hypothetical protein
MVAECEPRRSPRVCVQILSLVIASGCATAVANSEVKGVPTMSNTQAALQLLDALENDLPLSVEKLQQRLGIRLEQASRSNHGKGFELRGRASFSGLALTHLRFVPAGPESEAELVLRLDKNDVDENAIAKRMPKGFWVPPPPPGYGGVPEPRVAYVAERDWGQIWLAFTASGLGSISFGFGQHGSPGI